MSALPILLKLHPPPISHLIGYSRVNQVPLFPDVFPNSPPISLPYFARTLTSFLLSILSFNDPFPKGFSFRSISLIPFPMRALLSKERVLISKPPFLFSLQIIDHFTKCISFFLKLLLFKGSLFESSKALI